LLADEATQGVFELLSGRAFTLPASPTPRKCPRSGPGRLTPEGGVATVVATLRTHPEAPMTPPAPPLLDGLYAILGMDVVGFSELEDDPQVETIQRLFRWLHLALESEGIPPADVRWSPGGDGGHLTFATQTGGRAALDVAFRVLA